MDKLTLVDELTALYVWPQSVADHHADVLTPRQIEMLYAVGAVAERAAATIAALEARVKGLERMVAAYEAIPESATILKGQSDAG